MKLLVFTKGGRRTLALSEVGANLWVEQELLGLRDWKEPGMKEALRAIAGRLQLPSIALRMTQHQTKINDDGRAGEPIEPAKLPILLWNPSAKSGIDRALLFTIMRQKSDFRIRF